ncbi:hypothetical protein SCB29_39060, partial [Paraburkholderia sp. SIMBA_055]
SSSQRRLQTKHRQAVAACKGFDCPHRPASGICQNLLGNDMELPFHLATGELGEAIQNRKLPVRPALIGIKVARLD